MNWGSLTLLCALVIGCSPYRQQLERGRRYYENNQYEEALALWRDLGAHEDSLSRPQQARYAYLRGMTDFRLGFAQEAKYWLSLALATDALAPGGFEPQWRDRAARALQDLTRPLSGAASTGTPQSVQAIEAPPSPLRSQSSETGETGSDASAP